MKLAVLSDVHGNVPALEAVLEDLSSWGPELLVIDGDLVSRGAYSLLCLNMIEAAFPGALYLQGNHETFVLQQTEAPFPIADRRYPFSAFAQWAAAELASRIADLANWHDHADLPDLDGTSVFITHGSRLGNRDPVGINTHADDLPAKLGDPRALFVTAHTHRPMVRAWRDSLIVNVGSVGTPLDDDPRAAYGRFWFRSGEWHVEIRRLDFDRERSLADLERSGFLAAGGTFARLIQAEYITARALVGPWMRTYHDSVLEGEIEVEAAIDDYLRQMDLGIPRRMTLI